jgi:hypothetical protein
MCENLGKRYMISEDFAITPVICLLTEAHATPPVILALAMTARNAYTVAGDVITTITSKLRGRHR